MLIHWRQFLFGILGIMLFLLRTSPLEAQNVGSKDLVQPRPQVSTIAQGNGKQARVCEESGAGGHADGVILMTDGPALTLSISSAELIALNKKPFIDMTVVLKNHGIGTTLVPWSESAVTSARLTSDRNLGEVGYQAATVEFFLGAPFKNEGDLRIRSDVALWSQPENQSQSIRVGAGQWVELHVRGEIICINRDATQCLNRLRESKLQVSGWWYQRLLTETFKGDCIYSSAAYTERELESHVVDVTGAPYKSSEGLIFDSTSAPNR